MPSRQNLKTSHPATILLNAAQVEILRQWINRRFESLSSCAQKLAVLRSPKSLDSKQSIAKERRMLNRILAREGTTKRSRITRDHLRLIIRAAYPTLIELPPVQRKLEQLIRSIKGNTNNAPQVSEYRRFESGFALSARSLRKQWAKARRLAFVHINGQVYREERVEWFQIRVKKQKKSRFYKPPSSLERDETRGTMERRLAAEIEGCEMFELGKLEQLWVFIPTEDQFELWKKANSNHIYESYPALKRFWQLYLAKIWKEYRNFRAITGDTNLTLDIGLFEYPLLGLTGYFFDRDLPSAFFLGSRQLFGRDLKSERCFKVSATSGQSGQRHPSFEDIQMAWETLLKVSTPIRIPV